ncbi:right-handed parallel beta-helix repeat-containing protein [Natrialbaceae archaeon A-CW3]
MLVPFGAAMPTTDSHTESLSAIESDLEGCVVVSEGESIQAAVDAADSGETICVETGAYDESLQVTTEGITIAAAPGADPVLQGSSETGIEVDGAHNVTIEGLTIQGYSNNGVRVTGDGHNLTVRDTRIEDSGRGIWLENNVGSSAVIENNEIVNNGVRAIHIGENNEYVEVRGNHIAGNGGAGINARYAPHVVVVDNVIEGNSGNGISIWDEYAVVQNNTLSDNGNVAIRISHDGDHALVEENTITGSDVGIRAATVDSPEIRDNTITDATVDIELDRVQTATIVDNDLETGIALDGSTDTLEHFDHTASGNTIGDDPLVFVSGEDDPKIPDDAAQVIIVDSTNVEVSGLEFDGVASGIQIAYSPDAIVAENAVSNTGSHGIRVWASDDTVVSGNDLVGNDETSHVSGIGIHGSAGAVVAENTITDSSSRALEVGGSPDAIVRDNSLIDNHNGFHLTGSDRTAVTNNTITGTHHGETTSNFRSAILVISSEFVDIRGNELTDNHVNGIHDNRGSNSQYVTIEDNHIANNGNEGIYWSRSHDATIHNNTVTDNGRTGINGPMRANVTNNVVSGNSVGIDVSHDSLVADNVVQDNSGNGVEANADSTVRDNTIVDNGNAGIYFRYFDGQLVESNEVSGHAIDLWIHETTDVTVRHNSFESGVLLRSYYADSEELTTHSFVNNTVGDRPLHYVRNETGVEVPDDVGQVIVVNSTDVDVSGLEFDGVPAPVQVAYSHSVDVTDNSITSGTDTTTERGAITIWESTQSTIQRNTIVEMGDQTIGIEIINGESAEVDNNTITDVGRNGIAVENVDAPKITWNTVTGAGGDGIYTTVINGLGADVANNTVSNNNRGIVVGAQGSASIVTVTVLDNVVEHNSAAGLEFTDEAEDVQVHGNAIQNNGDGIVYSDHSPEHALNAVNNWWGAASGPSGGVADPETGTVADGDGDSVDEHVLFDPWDEVPSGSTFEIGIDDTNAPIAAGETLTVDVTVENRAGETDTQTIELVDFDGSVVDAVEGLTLEGGESESLTLTWETPTDVVGTGDITVQSEDDSDTDRVIVLSSEAIEVDTCTVIDSPGYYVLTGDIEGDATCLEITADDVVLDGMGHTVQGEDPNDNGIVVDDADGVTVRNVVISGWDVGLYFNEASNGAVTNVVTEHNGAGFNLRASNDNDVSNITTRYNDYRGLHVGSGGVSSHGNTFTDIHAYENEISGSSLYPGAIQVASGSANNVFTGLNASSNRAGLRTAGWSNTFADVVADDNSMYGLNLESNFGNEFENVSVARNGWNGIIIDDSNGNQLSNVTAVENDGAGVLLIGDTRWNTPVTGNVFHSVNATDNDGSGIQLSVADNSEFHDLELHNNDGSSLNLASRSSENTFTDVTISDSGWHGFYAGSDSHDNTITGLSVTNSEAAGIVFSEGASGNTVNTAMVTESSSVFQSFMGATDNTVSNLELDGVTLSFEAQDVTINGIDEPNELPDNVNPLDAYVTVTSSGDDPYVDSLYVHYVESDLTGIDESSLEVWRLADIWSPPSEESYDSGVNTDEQYVYATDIDEFGTFGVFGEPGTIPSITDATVDPTAIDEGESVTVTATVENVGDVDGDVIVALEIDDAVVDTTAIELETGETGQVTFTHTFEDSGTFDVSVSKTPAGTVTVDEDDSDDRDDSDDDEPEANVIVYGGSVTQSDVGIDDTVTITGDLYNSGDVAGDITVELTISGEHVDETMSQTVTIDPGLERDGVEFDWTPTEDSLPDGVDSDEVTITLNSLVVDTVSFEHQYSDIQVIAASTSETEVVGGNEFHVIGSIYQAGTIDGTEEITLTATPTDGGDPIELGVQEASLQPGFYHLGALNITASFEPDDAGTYDLELGDRNAGTIEVEPAESDINVIAASVSEIDLVEGEELYVIGSIYQAGNIEGTEEIELTATNTDTGETTVVGSQEATLAPGFYHLGAINVTHVPDEAGTYDLELGDRAAGTIEVASAESDIQVIAASISEIELVEGDEIHVVGSIYQAGTIDGPEEIEVTATNQETNETTVLGSQEVSLEPGFYHLGAINVTVVPEPGTYDIKLGDRAAGTIEVEPAESDIQVIAASASEIELIEGEEMYVVGSIYQAGNIEGTEEIELTATNVDTGESTVVGTQEVTLSPGFYHLGAINITHVPDKAGTYDLELGDRAAGTIEVEPAESDIQVIAASASEIELIEGEELYVVGSIYQAGNIEGTEEIELTATNVDTGESTVVGTQEVTLSPGFYHLGALNITHTPDEAGTYDLELGDRVAGTIEVEEAVSDIQVIAASTSDVEIAENEETHVIGSIYQAGNIEGTEEIELTATHEDGTETVVGTQDVTLAPGFYHLGALNVTFEPEQSGNYTLELGGTYAGTVYVEEIVTDIQVIAASTADVELIEGEETYVVGSVYQNGSDTATEEIELTATNQETNETHVVGSQEVTLAPGYYHLGALNITFAPDEPGTYDLELGGRNAGWVDVEPAESDINVIAASTSEIELVEGEELYVIGSIHQAGNIEGTEEIELTATNVDTGESTVVGSQEVTLAPGFYHLGALNVTYAPDEAGTYDLELGDRSAGTIEVEPAESDINVIAASTSEVELVEGEELYVIGSIYQNGTIEGTEEIELTATNTDTGETTVVGSQEVTLSPGFYHLGAINITHVPDKAGTYDLELGDRSAGTIEVEPAESDIQVIAASTSEIELVEGEELYVIGSIYQNGTIEGTEEIELTATNVDTGETEIVGSQEVTLRPGFYHLGAINVTYVPEEAGTYELELGDRNAGTIEVASAESDIQVIAASTSELEVAEGQEFYVIGSTYQAGTIEGPEEITLTATPTDGGNPIELGSQDVTLTPGWYHLGALNVSATLDQPGTYDLELGDRSAGQLVVTQATVEPTIVAVEGHSSASDFVTADGDVLDTDGSYVYASDDATVEVAVDADHPVDEVTVLVSSLDTTYSVSTTASRQGDTWIASIPFESLPDDGRYALSAFAADERDNGGMDQADETLVINRQSPSMSVSIEDVTHEDATIVIESTEPLEGLPTVDVTVDELESEGASVGTDPTVTGLQADPSGTTFTGTLEFDESGEYTVEVTGVDRAGNDATDTASVVVHTGFTLEDGTIEFANSGTTIDFDLVDDAEEAMKAEELFIALSENAVDANLEDGSLGVNFLTADLDSFIDHQLGSGAIEGATITMPVDETALPAGTTATDVGFHYYDEDSETWDPVDSSLEYVDDDPFLTATVDGFSTYGAMIVDEEPPTLTSVSPAPKSELPAGTDETTVAFAYEDDLSGVDVSSITIELDGVDVTDDDRTRITSSETTLEVVLEDGASHTVALTVADEGGNEETYTTSFKVATPDEPDDGSGEPDAPGDGDSDGDSDGGDSDEQPLDDDDHDAETGDDSIPGFGVVLVLAALLVVGLHRRRTGVAGSR